MPHPEFRILHQRRVALETTVSNIQREPVASLGWVTPGAATEGVTPWRVSPGAVPPRTPLVTPLERTMESHGLLTGEVCEASDHFALFQSEHSYTRRRRLEHPDAEWTALNVLVTVHYPYLPVSWSTHTATLLINARYRTSN